MLYSRRLAAAVVVVLTACASAGQRSAGSSDGVQSLIAAERAFARRSEKVGIKESFLANMGADGLLFRPGPVNGVQWLESHPPAPGYLSWDPEIAIMSASGEIGYTTGPWEFRAKGASDTVSRAGHYVTVWRRDSTGVWKMVLDIGTSHAWVAKPANAIGQVISVANSSGLDSRRQLLALDSTLGVGGRPQSAKLLGMLAEDARLHREGAVPALGAPAVRAALAADDRPYHSKRLGGDISRAGDFGYTYGEYDLVATFTRPAERGYYLRIWRPGEDGSWRVILDLAQPVRPPG